ncbi:MAG: DMT family transporter [Lautropia sp.]
MKRSQAKGMRLRRGIGFMVAGCGLLVANDALIKFASESMPLSQLMFVRGCFGTAFMLLVARSLGVTIRLASVRNGRVFTRATLDVMATVIYIIGLSFLPLANVTAISMTAPLMVTLLAILVFREQVKAAQWAAIGAGFLGVLLVVQPIGKGFNAWSLLILAATLLIALRDVVTRSLSREHSSLLLTLLATVLVTLGSGLWGLTEHWPQVDSRQYAVLAIASVFLSCGYVMVTIAMREGDMAIIAPFRYSSLIVSAVVTYLVWDQLPNAIAWCGIALTVVAGIYLIRTRTT